MQASIKIEGRTWSYVSAGQGATILLVHGFPLNHSMWRFQIEALSGQYHVLAPDLPGFGGSELGRSISTMPEFADDLARFMDELGVTAPVTFCGLSMGGYIAWEFARRHAKRLGRLVVCDTRSAADSAEAADQRRKLAARVRGEGTKVLADAMIPRLFSPVSLDQKPELVTQTRGWIEATSPVGAEAALLGMAERSDAGAWLPSLDLPTLVLCGESDCISPPAEMAWIAKALPRGEFHVVERAGHMAPLENPEVTNRLLLEFLNRTG